MKEKYIKVLLAVVIFALICGILHITKIGCPIKFLTGVSCPACGMTRAWVLAFTFHFGEAWRFHPLFFLIPVIILFILFKEKIGEKLFSGVMLSFAVIFIAVWLVRMFNPDDAIVVADFSQGLWARMLRMIMHI